MTMPRAAAARREGPAGARPRRLARDDRVERILDAAIALFGERGFEVSTRDIARELGVTQALVYRYFPSKKALVEAALARAFVDRGEPGAQALLSDASMPLDQRLKIFYRAMVARSTPARMRLWVMAGLSGLAPARPYSFKLTERVLKPIAAALRAHCGLPGMDVLAMTRGERELAMVLHGGIVFLNIRRHVYRMDLPKQLDDLVDLQVDAFVAGAPAALRRILAGEPASLAVELLR